LFVRKTMSKQTIMQETTPLHKCTCSKHMSVGRSDGEIAKHQNGMRVYSPPWIWRLRAIGLHFSLVIVGKSWCVNPLLQVMETPGVMRHYTTRGSLIESETCCKFRKVESATQFDSKTGNKASTDLTKDLLPRCLLVAIVPLTCLRQDSRESSWSLCSPATHSSQTLA
jgi:hypothetical protein